jgi:hypothetical protein
MLRDTLVCRQKIPGVSRKIWRHTKFTLDIIDSASEPKRKRYLNVKNFAKGVSRKVQKIFSVSRAEKFENHCFKYILRKNRK